MPVFNLRVRTSKKCLPISKTLTDLINSHQLGAERNIVVSVFSPQDNPEWESLPPIWHRPNGTDIVVNLGKFEQVMAETSPKPGYFLGNPIPTRTGRGGGRNQPTLAYELVGGVKYPALTEEAIERACLDITSRYSVDSANSRNHKTFLASGKVNPTPLTATHRFYGGRFDYSAYYGYFMAENLLIGAVIREAAYSVFTQQQVRDAAWFKRATGYERNIVTVFEELRVEAQAIKRIDGNSRSREARNYVRTATPITANVDQVVQDMAASVMSGGESGASVANVALNSSLILGRTAYDVLLRFEVESFHEGVDSLVGTDRLSKMYEIWSRYAAITDATEAEIMPLVREWIELFPSDDSGENAKSSVAPAPKKDPGDESEDEDGEGSGKDKGDEKGEDGDGSGEGEEDGEGEGQEGEGEGEGDEAKSGDGGDGKGEGEGEGDDKKSKGKQTKPKSKLKDAKGADAGRGTKGAHTSSYNAHNTLDKNSDEDPGKDEIIPSTELVKSMVGTDKPEEKATSQALIEAEHEEHDYGPKDITPSRISYAKAEHRHLKPGDVQDELARGRILAPGPVDYAMAAQLAKVLENLNITDRGKFTVADVAPPGRFRSRAAVQQAAERKLRLPATAQPWQRTKRTVDLNPPLTVGIMTDVSGSMGWAEKFVAEFTWIVQHAVSSINGRAAALAFGNGATVTLRPGERMQYAQVVKADGGGEEFDMGAGTLDTMLNLVNGQGTRMLFVVTDGHFVFENMMPKSRAWIKLLNSKGVHIIWVTPDRGYYDRDTEDGSEGFRATPDNVTVVRADALSGTRRGTGDYKTEAQKLMTSLGNEIQKAVRAARMNRRG